ncbi:hypothetical protein D3C81_1021170 [compost metagenome]
MLRTAGNRPDAIRATPANVRHQVDLERIDRIQEMGGKRRTSDQQRRSTPHNRVAIPTDIVTEIGIATFHEGENMRRNFRGFAPSVIGHALEVPCQLARSLVVRRIWKRDERPFQQSVGMRFDDTFDLLQRGVQLLHP